MFNLTRSNILGALRELPTPNRLQSPAGFARRFAVPVVLLLAGFAAGLVAWLAGGEQPKVLSMPDNPPERSRRGSPPG